MYHEVQRTVLVVADDGLRTRLVVDYIPLPVGLWKVNKGDPLYWNADGTVTKWPTKDAAGWAMENRCGDDECDTPVIVKRP